MQIEQVWSSVANPPPPTSVITQSSLSSPASSSTGFLFEAGFFFIGEGLVLRDLGGLEEVVVVVVVVIVFFLVVVVVVFFLGGIVGPRGASGASVQEEREMR